MNTRHRLRGLAYKRNSSKRKLASRRHNNFRFSCRIAVKEKLKSYAAPERTCWKVPPVFYEIQTLADNVAPRKKIHPLNTLAVSESRGAKKFSLKTYCGFFVLACWSEVAFSLWTESLPKSFLKRPTFPKQSQYISAITRTIGAPYNIM